MTGTILLLTPRRFADARGWFSETYNAARLKAAGLDAGFVQDNQSLSHLAGTIRGLHFQVPPVAQGKLVRVLRGRIRDIAVDIRRGSPTFGHWIAADLSGEDGRQIYIPPGFMHGFATLEPETEVFYKVTAPYDPASERGVRWSDPALAIDWGLGGAAPLVSVRDGMLPPFGELDSPFPFDGTPMELVEIAL